MKNLFIVIFALNFIGSVATAATSIQCGTVDQAELTVTDIKYEFSSEDDSFTGPVGGKWQMAEDGAWFKKSKSITAKTADEKITITKLYNKVPKVGKIYTLVGMYTDFPILTVKTIGGVAGGITKTVNCLGSYD